MENENNNEKIEELCYYCDLSAFKSIMENQTLWLSDIHCMNDSSEESLFLDALEEVMGEMFEELSDETKNHVRNDEIMNRLFRTCPHRDSCTSFRQILPVTALKILEGRQPVGGFLPCH